MPLPIFSCKRASRLISDSLDRELRVRERLVLWTHLSLCSLCRRFRRQTLLLERLTQEARERWQTLLKQENLPPEARARIRQRLEEERPPDDERKPPSP